MTTPHPLPAAGGAAEVPDDDSVLPGNAMVNPFPGSDSRAWTDRFAAVLCEGTGLPREITDQIAPFVSHPKRFMQRKGGGDALAESALSYDETGQLVVTVEAHGFAGNAGEYNERIRSSFAAPFQPYANERLMLPPLVTGTAQAGKPAPFITTPEPVPHNKVNALLGEMTKSLGEVNGDRTYDLAEDLEIHGQQQPTTHVALLRMITEPDPDGDGFRTRQLVDLTAVKGANRTIARLKLFGLTPKDVVFGVSPRTVMGLEPNGEQPSTDSRRWVPALADLLKAAYADPTHPGHAVALRARKIQTVKLRIIVGAPEMADFHSTVFDSNRVDHRRPPLEYRGIDRAASDMRALLRDLKTHNLISEDTRAWLAGEGPDPSPNPGESVVDARDRRDRALLDVVLPPLADKGAVSRWQRARVVLGEPSRTHTTMKHVTNRLRMYSAAASDSYRTRWNPRVMDGMVPATAIKRQLTYSGLPPWREVRAAAEAGDFSLLDQFIVTRGINWLVDAGLIEADRGSVGAQTATDDNKDDRQQLVRRSVSNYRAVMAKKPVVTFGLLLELAHAAEHNTVPRRVGEDGKPQDDTVANKLWMQTTFPKTSRRPKSIPDPLPPDSPAAEPEPDVQALRLAAQASFEEAVTTGLVSAVEAVFAAARELLSAAGAAGMPPLAEETERAVGSIEQALIAAGEDIETLTKKFAKLKHNRAKDSDFETSESTRFAEAVAE